MKHTKRICLITMFLCYLVFMVVGIWSTIYGYTHPEEVNLTYKIICPIIAGVGFCCLMGMIVIIIHDWY